MFYKSKFKMLPFKVGSRQALESDRPRLVFWPYYILTLYVWANYSPSLNLSFLACKFSHRNNDTWCTYYI